MSRKNLVGVETGMVNPEMPDMGHWLAGGIGSQMPVSEELHSTV